MSNTRSSSVSTSSQNILDVTESFYEILSKALYSHQTWSSFFGSFSSSIGSMILSVVLNNFISTAEVSRKEDVARKKIADAFSEAMICLDKTFHFSDARAFLEVAKKQFDHSFLSQVKTSDHYQQIYINVVYALALSRIHLGDLDHALRDIKQCQGDFPGIDFRRHDIDNLKGIIYLKKKQYVDANKAFLSSLRILPNQQTIIHLRLQCFMKDKSLVPNEIKWHEIACYLSNSSLFQTVTIDAYIFEVNLAHIEALISTYSYKRAFEKLSAIEKQYSNVVLSTSDQKKLYELILVVLNKLQESAPTDEDVTKKAPEYNSEFLFPQMDAFLPQKEKLLTHENLIQLLELYKIKLLVLNDSVQNVININKQIQIKQAVKKEKKVSNKSDLSKNHYRLFPMTALCAVTAIGCVLNRKKLR